MNRNTKLALAALLIGMFACNAPLVGLVPNTPVPSAIPATPTHEPTPTTVPTPASMDTAEGDLAYAAGKNLNVTAVVVVPTGPAPTIYLGTWGEGIYRSRDHGVNWIQLAGGAGQVTSLAIADDDPATLLIGTADMGVLRLTDDGPGSSEAPIGLQDTDVRSVAIDPVNPSVLYAGTIRGIYQSPDAGATWNQLGLADDEVDAIAFDESTGTVYAGTATDGLKMTTDGGVSWLNFSLSSTGVNALLTQSASPSVLYAATNGRGVARVAVGEVAVSRG